MTSSREVAWAPPPLSRARPEALVATGTGSWLLPDLGGPLASPPPADASYEAGYADGLRDGVDQAGEQLQPTAAALRGILHTIEERRGEILGDRRRDVEALALAVARRIVQHDIAADPTLVAVWITRAVALLPHDLHIDVRLHPEDLAALAGLRDTIVPADAGVVLHWIADPSVGLAGFVVESPQRLVDGRLDVALRDLYERFDAE